MEFNLHEQYALCSMGGYMFVVSFCPFNIECKRGIRSMRSMIFYDELVILECDSRHSLSCYFFPLSESDNAPDYLPNSINI